jgi:hypothetical protein
VALRARWVTLRARWVTLRARWVTLRARWVTEEQAGVDARYSGPPCVQLDPDGLVVGDEDCLTLDVVTLTASFALVSALGTWPTPQSPPVHTINSMYWGVWP